MKNKKKLKIKEKLALALFMEAVPKLIELWQMYEPLKTFDEFLMDRYLENKMKGAN